MWLLQPLRAKQRTGGEVHSTIEQVAIAQFE
jgi:hypothetical protein